MIKVGDRVEFWDEHAQTVTKVTKELDDYIVWLRQTKPNDPAWVLLSELTYSDTEKRWLYHG